MKRGRRSFEYKGYNTALLVRVCVALPARWPLPLRGAIYNTGGTGYSSQYKGKHVPGSKANFKYYSDRGLRISSMCLRTSADIIFKSFMELGKVSCSVPWWPGMLPAAHKLETRPVQARL